VQKIERYAPGQTVTFYGKHLPVEPITTAHGTVVGYVPGQSVGYYRDGFLQEVTVHETPYDAREYAKRRRGEACRLPLPYLRSYPLI
jgi:hypothetical protein